MFEGSTLRIGQNIENFRDWCIQYKDCDDLFYVSDEVLLDWINEYNVKHGLHG